MSRDEAVVKAYVEGGAGERLDTYLANPDLRGRFDEIERETERASPHAETIKGENRLGRCRRRFAALLRSGRP